MPVVWPDEDEVRVLEPSRGGDQVLDPLPCGDPTDSEDERRVPRDTGRLTCGGRLSMWGRRLGEAVAAHDDALGGHAARDDVVSLARGGDDDDGGARRNATRDGRVERSLQPYLPQPRPEHPQRLEDVRDPAGAAPERGACRDRVAEAEDMGDIRAPPSPELQRQRRRDPHPAVAEGRGQVVDGRSVHRLDAPVRGRPAVHVDQRRRDDVHAMSSLDEPAHELSRHHHGPAERPRGPVGGTREQDRQRRSAHGARRYRSAS